MTNPVVHALVLIAAIIIPGGLLVYLAWAARKARAKKSQRPTPEEARNAFLAMYPRDSLRAQDRCSRLDRAKTFRHRNSE
jgi:hypothetical protein